MIGRIRNAPRAANPSLTMTGIAWAAVRGNRIRYAPNLTKAANQVVRSQYTTLSEPFAGFFRSSWW